MLKFTNLKDSRFQDIDSNVMDALYCYKGLILAGGAVRDTLFGTEISDYDLFLTSEAYRQSKPILLVRDLATHSLALLVIYLVI